MNSGFAFNNSISKNHVHGQIEGSVGVEFGISRVFSKNEIGLDCEGLPCIEREVASGGGNLLNATKQAKQWLGKDYRTITNKAGDNIFMSNDGLRKIRFDIKNLHGDAPHLHLEIFKNGKWRDAILGTHRIYPKQ